MPANSGAMLLRLFAEACRVVGIAQLSLATTLGPEGDAPVTEDSQLNGLPRAYCADALLPLCRGLGLFLSLYPVDGFVVGGGGVVVEDRLAAFASRDGLGVCRAGRDGNLLERRVLHVEKLAAIGRTPAG